VQRDARTYLDDIVEACDKVSRYTAAMTLDAFRTDEKTVDAVVRNLEVIGEAAKKVPDDLRSQLPDVDWQRIAGLRDVLIHQYFGIDLEIVWDVVRTKVPLLRERVALFLSQTS
jgi:uncharacterized protein with HEPN domain